MEWYKKRANITTSPSLIKGRGIKGEGYLIKSLLLFIEIASSLALLAMTKGGQDTKEILTS